MKQPMIRYRPTRVANEGGSVETLANAQPMWGEFLFHSEEIKITNLHISDDVILHDIFTITTDADQYRVISILREAGALTKSVTVEKLDKPIE